MSPPLLGIEGEGPGNVSLMASSKSVDCISKSGLGLTERNYLGLSDSSSVESSGITTASKEDKSSLNLKATELRLGLPGSQSPERGSTLNLLSSETLDEKTLFPLLPSKDGICSSSQVSGNKRGFSDTIDGFSAMKSSNFSERNWMFTATGSNSETSQSVIQGKFAGKSGISAVLSNKSSGTQANITNEVPTKAPVDRSHVANATNQEKINVSNNGGNAPAAK